MTLNDVMGHRSSDGTDGTTTQSTWIILVATDGVLKIYVSVWFIFAQAANLVLSWRDDSVLSSWPLYIALNLAMSLQRLPW